MSDAKPREKITVPIVSDISKVSDRVLFEDYENVVQHFYLPRYRIAEILVSGKRRLRVKLKDDQANRSLIIYLEKYPASELGDSARSAQELQHQVRLMLRFGGQHELVFQEVTFSDNILRGVLRVESASKLAELVNAITDADYNTTLVIQRTLNLASPYDAAEEIAALNLNRQRFEIKIIELVRNPSLGSEPVYLPEHDFERLDSERERRRMLGIERERDRRERREPARERRLPSIDPEIEEIYILSHPELLRERKELQQAIANINQRIEFLQSTPLFVETELLLEEEIPFIFHPDIYEYIFRDVGDTTGMEDGLIQYQVVWNGISYSYYQEEERPTVFRYLPHAFKLASLPDEPDIPYLSVQFVWDENTTQPSGVQLTYRAVPFVDAARRAAEAEQLRQQAHQEPTFEPLTSPSRLEIAIPATWSFNSQPHIKEPIDLRQGFEDTVTLKWKGFRQIYNSLFDRASLLKGEVIAQVNPQQQELIPFVARVDDFVGSSTSAPDPSALLQRLLGAQVAPKIERQIQVTTYEFMFKPPPARPDDPVIAILVDFFERGNKISLTPEKLSVKVKLRLSVSDYVLSKSDEGDYRYQVTFIYNSGQQVKEPEKTCSDDDLYITLGT